MIQLYAEHLLNIRTLSIQASLSTVSNEGTKATLSADGRTFTLSHENETAGVRLPVNISPTQQSNVKFTVPAIPSKEISFRVQLDGKSEVQNGALSNGADDSSNLVPWNAGSLTRGAEICCARCNSILVERGRIQTWKDLPSQGWAEMMEFWHCHKPHEPHSHAENGLQKGYAAAGKLAVESGVGLVDVVDFIFARDDCRNLMTSNPDTENESLALRCTRCSSTVGTIEATTNGYQLHKPCLSVALQPDQGPVSYPTTKWLACQVLAAVESQGVRKFSVQSPAPKSIGSFRIWVLTPDLTVSSSTAPSSEPIRTMKVLWHVDYEQDENQSDMRKFLTESELRLEADEVPELIHSLQKTSLWIPEKARGLQGWHVGLLERFINADFIPWKAGLSVR